MASPENKSFTPLTRHTVTLAHGPTATITACYASSAPLAEPDPAKPTLVLLNSFTTDSSLFAPQFADAALRGRANLLAVDLLGHGGTRVGGGAAAGREDVARPHWTYWDSAWMALGVLREVGVERAVVAGTSQGGWVAVRMALLAPEMVSWFGGCFVLFFFFLFRPLFSLRERIAIEAVALIQRVRGARHVCALGWTSKSRGSSSNPSAE